MKILLIFLCVGISLGIKAQSKPNVIYIYADDLGYGELGCYGQMKIKTPNLDKMAAQGMRFTQHYTSSPVCAPARCMLLTGKHAGHSFVRGNYEMGGFADSTEGGQMPLPDGTFTMAKMMKKAGYATGAIGKWGLGMNNTTGNPNSQGFDYFYGYLDQKQAHNYYPTHLWENGKIDVLQNTYFLVHQLIPENSADEAFEKFKGKDYSIQKMAIKTTEFIKKNKNKPFFLYLPYTLPHVALQAPDEEIEAYIGSFDEKPYYGKNHYSPSKYPLSTYAAMITNLDRQVGNIMELLKELNLENNTLLMFSSDNGPTYNVGGVNAEFFNSTAGLRGRKEDLYEGGIREPFIAKWPQKIKAGSSSDLISVQYDLMATLAELVGQKAWQNDGVSFLPTLLGKKAQQLKHDYLYFEFPEKSGQVAIVTDRWKGVKSNMKKNKNSPWEIYDLKNDKFETTDVAAQHADLVARFEKILQTEHQQATIREWEFVDPKFPIRNE